MTDIVEWLRSPHLATKEFYEAADEIERMREALRLMPKTITEAADEIERLRDALKKVDTLQMALLLIAEDGLHDPTVKNFIISALKGNE